eukprot:SAG11_NODE_16621_length_542_cov_1.051919_1_plen_71_part_10
MNYADKSTMCEVRQPTPHADCVTPQVQTAAVAAAARHRVVGRLFNSRRATATSRPAAAAAARPWRQLEAPP